MNNSKVPKVKRGEVRPDALKTSINPKWTISEEALGCGMEASREWNNDSIMRFNELTKMVIQHRKKPKFELNGHSRYLTQVIKLYVNNIYCPNNSELKYLLNVR